MAIIASLNDRVGRTVTRPDVSGGAIVFARLALAAGFLTSLADRFGLLGPAGTGNVYWGNFESFTAYTHQLAPYLSGSLTTGAAVAVTLVECVLGLALLLGLGTRLAGIVSAGLLLIFALSLGLFLGWQMPLSSSVFTAAAAGILLSRVPTEANVVSLDRMLLRARPRPAADNEIGDGSE